MEKLPAGATTISGQSGQSLKLTPDLGLMQGFLPAATETSRPSQASSRGGGGGGGTWIATCARFSASIRFAASPPKNGFDAPYCLRYASKSAMSFESLISPQASGASLVDGAPSPAR